MRLQYQRGKKTIMFVQATCLISEMNNDVLIDFKSLPRQRIPLETAIETLEK